MPHLPGSKKTFFLPRASHDLCGRLVTAITPRLGRLRLISLAGTGEDAYGD